MRSANFTPGKRKRIHQAAAPVAPTIVEQQAADMIQQTGLVPYTPLAEGKETPRICAAASIQHQYGCCDKRLEAGILYGRWQTRLFHFKG